MDEMSEKSGARLAIWGCSGCLLIIGVVILFGVWLVSRTGLARIPVFSSGYEAPEPTRVVESNGAVADVASVLKDSLSISYAKKEATVVLSDEVMTGLIQSMDELGKAGDLPVDFGGAQIAALESGALEVFMPLDLDAILGRPDDGQTSAITVALVPSIEEGELDFELDRIRVGRLTIPLSMVEKRVDASLEEFLKGAFGDLSESVELKSIEVGDGEIVLTGSLDVGSLNLLR